MATPELPSESIISRTKYISIRKRDKTKKKKKKLIRTSVTITSDNLSQPLAPAPSLSNFCEKNLVANMLSSK